MEWSGFARTLSQKNGFNFALPSDSPFSLVSLPREERRWLCEPSEGFPALPDFGGRGGGTPIFGGGGGLGAGGLGGGGGGGLGGGGAAFPGGSGNCAPGAPFIASDSCPSEMGRLLTLNFFLLEFPKPWDVCEEPERLNIQPVRDTSTIDFY